MHSATKAAVKVISDSLRSESLGKTKGTTVKPTGVFATNLLSSVVNHQATIGLMGSRVAEFGASFEAFSKGTMSPEQLDPNRVRYRQPTPEDLGQNVAYVINQPWDVNIRYITVRASGEDIMF